MEDIRIKEISLPSGKKAKIVNYYTRGEKVAIEKEQWGDAQADIQETGEVKFTGIPINYIQIKQNLIVFYGTKEFDGKPITMEIINDLSLEDFNTIYKELEGVFIGKKNETSKK